MTVARYQVDLPVFSGPLDLLLHLIERQELDITAISLAQVAEQYLAQIQKLKEDRLEHLIDFIVIGARLALIKSCALLPQTPASLTNEIEEEDPAEALLRQLRLYKRFKQAAAWLQAREERGLRTHLRVAPPPRLQKQLDLSGVTGVTVEALITAVREILARSESTIDSVALIQPSRITIEGQIKQLRGRLQSGGIVLFHELLSRRTNRIEVTITLLAILELIKQQEIHVHQPALFGPIQIVPQNPT